jgi:hypothetical protein
LPSSSDAGRRCGRSGACSSPRRRGRRRARGSRPPPREGAGNRRPKGGRIEARIIAKGNGTREGTLYQD